ncbi:protein FAM32A-like isoform X1 [Coregonus clupeaformis]|uniref:protein FAM32A-like isoform X1 n=1 Tax=Coregonus clupeaformis TaxID=59861 RepID=UPI001BDF7FF1|nr:protein FAM32A-like isoform X1 [Coregonus clupeaformis]
MRLKVGCQPPYKIHRRRRIIIIHNNEDVGSIRHCPEWLLEIERDWSCFRRKKKKDKEKKQRLEQQINTNRNEEEETKSGYIDKRTPAQIAFDKMQEKRQMERILNKAEKTHKRRVEDFNRHLDSLTEHYDIPKVSWTK